MVQSQSLYVLDLIESLNVFLKTERIWKDLLLEKYMFAAWRKSQWKGVMIDVGEGSFPALLVCHVTLSYWRLRQSLYFRHLTEQHPLRS